MKDNKNQKKKRMIKFKLKEGVDLPKYESKQAVGLDVVANSIIKAFKGDTEIVGDKLEKMRQGFEQRGYIKLRPFERILFGTGVYAQLSNNIELQIRSRSGISLKRGLFVANQPGTIDPDYRGEIGVIIYNSTPFLNKIENGDRIAQLIPKEIIRPYTYIITEEDFDSNTERGEDGFGSTDEN